ncbi:MAG: carbon-nitrogen hydrolase family protein [Dehalococcoidia bacterium]|nr:carbon-nitrogen hydrolase family protein [Dehalococcoidia bacterium]
MSRPLKVALLQLRAFDLGEHATAWGELLQRVDEAGAAEPRLIVLPEASYPAYFLHSRAAYERAGVRPDAEVEGELGERAARFGCYIAAGLVSRRPDPRDATGTALHNACVLFGPDGHVAGRYTKSFLWHFDRDWFTAGTEYPVFDIDGAAAGLLVCADGRLPEITRSFAVAGARLIVDCTAWVSWARERALLSSAQIDYIMPARAIENGAWVVAADKVGVEAGSIVYAGRSGVIDPAGRWVAQAPADRDGLLTCTIDLDAAGGPPVERRPHLYAGAATPGQRSRAAALAREPLVAEDAAARVGAVALAPAHSAVALMQRARTIVRALAAQGTALVVLPDLAGLDARAVTKWEALPLFAELSAERGTLLTVQLAERSNGRTFKTAYLLLGGELLVAHRQTHLSEAELRAGFSPGDEPPPVVETTVGNVGLLAGSEGLVPELARSLKWRGAEVIAWSAGALAAPLRTLARTRANENRAYVIAAGTPSAQDGAYVIDPSGAVLGETLAGEEMATAADLNRVLARWNDMAPGTNPVRDRPPGAFESLFAARP